jgi:hypothetical protein
MKKPRKRPVQLSLLPAMLVCLECGKDGFGTLPGRAEVLCATHLVKHSDFGRRELMVTDAKQAEQIFNDARLGLGMPPVDMAALAEGECEGCGRPPLRRDEFHVCYCVAQRNLCDACRAKCLTSNCEEEL